MIINFRLKLNNRIQSIVDTVNGEKADVILTISHSILGIGVFYSLLNFYQLTIDPIREPMNTNILVFLICLSLFVLYSSQLGNRFNKPSMKIIQYSWIVLSLSILSLSYISATFNILFVDAISKIRNIDVLPAEMLVGNIRVVTTLVPLVVILPALFISLDTLKDKKSKEKIRSFEFETLLPTVHKSNDTTIDLEIGKDFKTGMPLIVPEKILYSHAWIQGSSGSGKTSNALLPFEEQLLRQKSYLNYNLKKIAIDCLENGVACINKPITNAWLNENFNMDYIEPLPGKEKDFYKAFEKFTIGIIDDDEIIDSGFIDSREEFLLPKLKSNDHRYICTISIHKNELPFDTIEFDIQKGEEIKSYNNPYLIIESKLIKPDKQSDENKESYDRYKLEEENASILLSLDIKKSNNNDEELNKDLSYHIKIELKGSGKIVPKNLGMTVVAPDGELINTTVDLGKDYGIKVHKIDPDKAEIKKGNVSTFNPLIGDSPEKIGDIVASILVSMDSGDSNKTNPYFTNASVRAIRNLVILLKITYKDFYRREPTLSDVLYYLNNMNSTSELLIQLMSDSDLYKEYQTVADYFVTSFIDKDVVKDDNISNKDNYGSAKKETQRALGGIVNQLDNLLGREEIRDILCPKKNSLDLAEVLRNGECIAISTRQGNLGPRLGKAFALFFILSLQNVVLSRYAENENPEIPHFLIIDEFPMYCNENTETFFTFARKYKCSVTVAIQNMGQLKKVSDEFGETIFTNTSTKILMANSNIEDRKYWSDFFGTKTEMEYMSGITTSSIFADNPSYSEQLRGSVAEVRNVTEEDLDNLKFKQMMFSYTNSKGRKKVGKASTDFVSINPEPYMTKQFDFEKFGISSEEYNKNQQQTIQQELYRKNIESEMETQKKIEKLKPVDGDLFSMKTESEKDPIKLILPDEKENLEVKVVKELKVAKEVKGVIKGVRGVKGVKVVKVAKDINKNSTNGRDQNKNNGEIDKALKELTLPTKSLKPKIDISSNPSYIISSSIDVGKKKVELKNKTNSNSKSNQKLRQNKHKDIEKKKDEQKEESNIKTTKIKFHIGEEDYKKIKEE